MMNYQEENQLSQLHQNEPPAPPASPASPASPVSPVPLIFNVSIAPLAPPLAPVIYRSVANERIYDDVITLPQVPNLTDLPVIYRSVANERIYDDISNNFSHQNDILNLSQEMTYMGIEPH